MLQLQLKAHLAEYNRLSDEINTRLAKEGTVIQVFLGVIAGIFTVVMYADIPNKVTLIAFLLPPVEILFLWFYSAHHIKLKKCCTHTDWIAKKVNRLLGEKILTWDRDGVTQKLGELNSVIVYSARIVTHEVFFAMIVIPTIILVIFQMKEFSAVPELDFLSFRSGLFIGVIYISLLIINLMVMFLIYQKDIWFYKDEKKKEKDNPGMKMNSPGVASPEAMQMEYRELCAYHRHQRGLTWQLGSILVTASLAIFGIVASRHDILPLSVLFASGIVSLVTLTLFWLAFERISYLNDIMKARMKMIEVELGMYLIRAYTEVDSEYGRETSHPIGRRLQTTWLIRVLVVVYTIGWVSLWVLKNG